MIMRVSGRADGCAPNGLGILSPASLGVDSALVDASCSMRNKRLSISVPAATLAVRLFAHLGSRRMRG